jgi:hypothetical protein
MRRAGAIKNARRKRSETKYAYSVLCVMSLLRLESNHPDLVVCFSVVYQLYISRICAKLTSLHAGDTNMNATTRFLAFVAVYVPVCELPF